MKNTSKSMNPYDGLTVRAANCCHAAGLNTKAAIKKAIQNGSFRPYSHCGWKSWVELHVWLNKKPPFNIKRDARRMHRAELWLFWAKNEWGKELTAQTVEEYVATKSNEELLKFRRLGKTLIPYVRRVVEANLGLAKRKLTASGGESPRAEK
jgi:hypothetical protein